MGQEFERKQKIKAEKIIGFCDLFKEFRNPSPIQKPESEFSQFDAYCFRLFRVLTEIATGKENAISESFFLTGCSVPVFDWSEKKASQLGYALFRIEEAGLVVSDFVLDNPERKYPFPRVDFDGN